MTEKEATSNEVGVPLRPRPSRHTEREKDTSSDLAQEEVPVRDRTQVPMYLTDDDAKALKDLIERADAISTLAGKGGISKNYDFYPALVEYVTQENRKDFFEFLGVE